MNLTDSGTRAVSTINMFSNSHFFRKNDRATVQPVALQNGDFCIVSCKSGVPSVLLRCWLGDRKGILPVKTLFQQSQCSLQVLRRRTRPDTVRSPESRPVKQQEVQLMLTNPRDALRGQSRSPKPFDMLGMVSY